MNGADKRKMEVGVNEMLRSNVEECEMRNQVRDQLLREWEKMMRGKPRMCQEDGIKRDLERVAGEWRTTATNGRSWGVVIKNGA